MWNNRLAKENENEQTFGKLMKGKERKKTKECRTNVW